MPIHLTPDQARRLGVDTADAQPVDGTRGRRSGGRRPRVPYHTQCVDCGEHFTTQAAETRHLNQTRHACYQLILEFDGDTSVPSRREPDVSPSSTVTD